MPFIQNVSKFNIMAGVHTNAGPNAVLIQIADNVLSFPKPNNKFAAVHQFDFLDVDDVDISRDNAIGDFAITDHQASTIVEILRKAMADGANVIVHCNAGLCRSGAVAEVGVILGFADTHATRLPNMLVKKKLMQVLGLAYDDEQQPDDFVREGDI